MILFKYVFECSGVISMKNKWLRGYYEYMLLRIEVIIAHQRNLNRNVKHFGVIFSFKDVKKRKSKQARLAMNTSCSIYWIAKSSTSKYKVAPPGIIPPAPRSPYPRRGGMMI